MEPLKQIKFIVVHHSGSHDSYEAIKNLHVNVNGWEGIGYHWLVDKIGNLLKGRDEKFIGAHVLGHNKNSIAVCLIGDFDLFPTREKQMSALMKFLREKMREHNVPPENVLGHREVSEKEKICPGKFFDMDEVRKELNR